MIVEQAAYGSRLRRIDPVAKVIASAAGMAGAFLSPDPAGCLGIATIFGLLTVMGGGTRPILYGRALLPPLSFLLVGSLSLLVSIDLSAPSTVTVDPRGWERAVTTASRSAGVLSSLLFLSLTTPMTDLAGVARRGGVPDTLVEIMTVGYRMIFLFLDSLHEIRTAQSARLGYADLPRSARSARIAAAAVATRLFVRVAELSRGAEARSLDADLRGIPPRFPHPLRDRVVAVTGSLLLVSLVMARGWG